MSATAPDQPASHRPGLEQSGRDDAPVLRVRGLTTELGGAADPTADRYPVRVCDDVSLEIRRGETLALLGESGCGKSMTALSLMRLLPLSGRIIKGSVELAGTELLTLPEYRMRQVRGGRMAMIFQEPQTSLNPVLTIGAQIAEAVRLHAGTGPNAGPDDKQEAGPDASRHARRPVKVRLDERVVELLRAVGIPDPARRLTEYPHQLSGGMKQRVMIAMALAGDPQLLIADEPTTALDVTIQAQVLRLLKSLQAETGMAVLLITHDLGVVAETADRLAVMYAGQIVEQADSQAFFAVPAHPYSRKLMESLPNADKRRTALAVIPGRVPPLDQPFVGCRFADRCFRVMPPCRSQVPDWYPAAPGHSSGHSTIQSPGHSPGHSPSHQVRCLLWADGPAQFAPPGAAVSDGSASTGDDSLGGTVQGPLLDIAALEVHFPIQRGLFKHTVGQVRAVDGVDLLLRPGRTLALVGESGCGKTTVGKGLLQLVRPTGGSVHYQGVDLVRLRGERLRRLRKDLQIIFQDPFASMNPRMLVGDIVGEGLLALGLEPRREARRARVAALLEQVGIGADAMARYPHEFSGGQRQRICIARALAVEPKVIVCDEPTSALDVSVQAQILNLLKQLQRDLGLAYLFISHDISVVSYLAHEVAVMYLGRIVEHGSADEVLGDPRHPYTQALLSAVPVIDAGADGQPRASIRLEGDMPSPANPPAGCHFHPRCPQAIPACRQAYPDRIQTSPPRSVRCILAAPPGSPAQTRHGDDRG